MENEIEKTFKMIINSWIVGQNNQCFKLFKELQPNTRELFIKSLHDKTFYQLLPHDDCFLLMRFLLIKSTQQWD